MKQMTPEMKRLIDDVTKQLIDEGRLIEAGWRGLRVMAIKPDAPEVQLVEMRAAFFAGAQHLFGSMMGAMGPEAEPTEKDMERLDMIGKELSQFIGEFGLYVEQRTGRRI
jgi:hypothetical protein